ncbi:MAG: cation transporter [Chlorobiales bacterium]|jgi:cobalt-zinc-cadmium efflux system protein|nr:cation transporter [Chlorobiales bacterium]
MSHHHDHGHHHHSCDHHHHHATAKNLKLAFALNFLFTLIEFVGGVLTNSMAIISDAVHDLGDTLAIGMSLFFERISHKKSDERFSYGYKRFALVSALINSIILLVGSLFVIYKTVPRLISPEPVDAGGMVLLAIFGVLVNGAAVLRLKSGKSANERVIMLHLLEDALGWVAVLAGSIVMYFFDLPVIDPILSIAISAFILWNVFKNLKDFIATFLQGVPEGVDVTAVQRRIETIENVLSAHDVHIWTMDGSYNIISAHVVIADHLEKEALLKAKADVKQLIRSLGIQHETIEFEYESETCDFVNCC